MSALAGIACNTNIDSWEAVTRRSNASREIDMREKAIVVRDTLIVLVVQLVFRATMFMRSLNY
jgi:hypothetical protein